MLEPEELKKLDFPENVEHSSPVKSVVCRSDSGHYPLEGNTTLKHHNRTLRFNSFSGYQTLEEREKSFHVIFPCSVMNFRNILCLCKYDCDN